MDQLIEPNIHPFIVHFVVAFLLTSPLFLLVSSFSSRTDGTPSKLQIAGDWMLALGILSALAAVAAGLQAYYSVDHDGPSHAAMTIHRNMAFATVGVFAIFGIWRFATRTAAPSKLFALLFLLASLGVGVTAWKGGQLVYRYGLGVQSLPTVTGDGHDHDHNAGEEHDSSAAINDEEEAHDHDDHEHDANEVESASGVENESSLAPAYAPMAPIEFSSLTPVDVVIAFQTALVEKDEAAISKLAAPDVIIAEGGGAERSLEEYRGHHMPADMAFMAAVTTTMKQRDTLLGEDMAIVITESQLHGTFRDKNVHVKMMETMVLQHTDTGWRITHIHWSNAPLKEEHEH